MAEFSLGSALGGDLSMLLSCDSLKPGDPISYQLAKSIYEYHPLGAKLVEAPTRLAQSQPRMIEISKGPEDRVKKAFLDEWKKLDCDTHIFNLMRLSRLYGIASIAMIVDGDSPDKEVDFTNLAEKEIAFNVYDPLNTAGSLVINQNPNAEDFLKTLGSITVSGTVYHRSRVVIKMNEEPIYLSYTNAAFGFVGRSVYQRALYPLKSFLQTMVADDMVARKAGVIVAKMKQAGSIVNQMMAAMAGVKRAIVKESETDNVITITTEEEIASIDLQNVNAALTESRKNILNNIASGASMPAILVNEETFAEGFGEGTEDARHVALWIDHHRREMDPIYKFFDTICQFRAWNQKFYKTIQADFPETYGSKSFEDAIYEWQEAFTAVWPSLLTEPDSEKAKGDEVRLNAVTQMLGVLLPNLDPKNQATLMQWAQDNFNSLDMLFSARLVLDPDSIVDYLEDQKARQAMNAVSAEDAGFEPT